MKLAATVFCLLICALPAAGSREQAQPLQLRAADPRIPIHLADARRENWACLMRGHLRTLVEAMQHLSAGEYVLAAAVTEENYGLAPGTTEYCKEALFTKPLSVAAASLPPQPPEPVRAMFGAMQTAAAAFAQSAREVPRTGDPGPAWKSLAVLGGLCSACHASYRIEGLTVAEPSTPRSPANSVN